MGYATIKMLRCEKDEESGAEFAVFEVPMRIGDSISFPRISVLVRGFEPGTYRRRVVVTVGESEFHLEDQDNIALHGDTAYGKEAT